jgi:hypothetical protein
MKDNSRRSPGNYVQNKKFLFLTVFETQAMEYIPLERITKYQQHKD